VTAAIWGKAAPLSDAEWERVRLHPYFTERVLQRPPSLAPLATLAAAHHERIDGSGYHRSTAGAQLPFLARILCAADVYHALTEPRAHRAAFARDSAASVLQQEARVGRLDRESVDAVLAAAGHQVRPSRHSGPAGLSAREVEVLSLLARGSSIKDVASRLTVSPATANHHVRHIYTKLGVSTRAAATLFAMQHNLVELGDDRTIA
jgi:HD-GYP domain-containing protein (c-di-GMP phosphodiesterase class II)